MAPTLAERAESIFLEAGKIAEESRPAYLDQACAGEPELRLEVDALIAAAAASEAYFGDLPRRLGIAELLGGDHNGGDGLAGRAAMETGDFSPAPGSAAETADNGERRCVGPYRLLRELGRGGMGSVWLAERSDGLISRPVALKFPRGFWIRAGLRERMAREREILASLEHPGIARLYDAGLTDSGDPWLALEFVEGRALNDYCATEQPRLLTRLDLFLQVADAVAYAHSKLIVHRDLKPENILVTPQLQARLLDFGIGKLLDEQQSREARLTELTGRALTPDYASPEQISGQPLTVATDIYSLGVILFELLTGERPYRLKRESAGALEDAILETVPEPPSRVAALPGLKGRPGADLDAITLKALKKAPEERYPTVQSLADDLRRCLAGHPVTARPDTRGYRLRKFLLRHKVAAATGAITAAAILIGAGVALWQAEVAKTEARRAESVTAFIASIFQGLDPNHLGAARAVTASEILEQAERRISSELAGQPHTRLRLRSLIARSYLGLFEAQRAQDVLEQLLAEAETLPDLDPETLRTAHLLMAQARVELGQYDEAENHIELVLSMIDEPDDTIDYILARVTQSDLAYQRGDYEAAFAAGQDALDTARSLRSAGAALRMGAHKAVGKAVGMLRRTEESLVHNRRAFELALDAFGNDRDHPKVLETEHNLAASLIDVGRPDEAIVHLERSLEAARKTYGEESLLAGQYAVRLGLVQLERGDLKAAIELIDNGIRLENTFETADTPATSGRRLTLGRAYAAARRMSDAAREADAAVDIMAQFDTPFMMRVVEADQAYARAAAGGSIPDAIAKLEEVIEGQDAGEARYKTHLPDIYAGTLHLWNGDALSAIGHLERGVVLARAQTRVAHLGEALTWLGLARLENGDPAGADQALQEALELLESVHVEATPAKAEAMVGLGRVALANGEPDAALTYLEDADRFWATFDAENRAAGIAAFWLGWAQAALDLPDAAEASFERAKRLLTQSPLPADNVILQRIDAS